MTCFSLLIQRKVIHNIGENHLTITYLIIYNFHFRNIARHYLITVLKYFLHPASNISIFKGIIYSPPYINCLIPSRNSSIACKFLTRLNLIPHDFPPFRFVVFGRIEMGRGPAANAAGHKKFRGESQFTPVDMVCFYMLLKGK